MSKTSNRINKDHQVRQALRRQLFPGDQPQVAAWISNCQARLVQEAGVTKPVRRSPRLEGKPVKRYIAS